MPRARFAVHVLVAASLLGASGGGLSALDPAAVPLQGAWEIVSVQRDGDADATEVGGLLTFAGNTLTFRSRVIDLNELATMQVQTIALDEKALARMAMS